jgi:Transglutaminase-like superfamily
MSHRADSTADSAPVPLGAFERIGLLGVVWRMATEVSIGLRRQALPELVTSLSNKDGSRPRPIGLMSHAVSRGLRIGTWQPRCLVRALVLYRLLRAQGEPAVLVIGLADDRPSKEAHAWVEVNGRDVGPWPGAFGHRALARYPVEAGDHDHGS